MGFIQIVVVLRGREKRIAINAREGRGCVAKIRDYQKLYGQNPWPHVLLRNFLGRLQISHRKKNDLISIYNSTPFLKTLITKIEHIITSYTNQLNMSNNYHSL